MIGHRVTPDEEPLPYPGCAAALKCVTEEYCDINGVMITTPLFLTEKQKLFRVPMSACFDPETAITGFCCRDPLYQDPWPANMPMPNMPKAAVSASTFENQLPLSSQSVPISSSASYGR